MGKHQRSTPISGQFSCGLNFNLVSKIGSGFTKKCPDPNDNKTQDTLNTVFWWDTKIILHPTQPQKLKRLSSVA